MEAQPKEKVEVKPELPFYARHPNTLLKYEFRKKELYIERVAVYLTKKKVMVEEVAQIYWLDKHFKSPYVMICPTDCTHGFLVRCKEPRTYNCKWCGKTYKNS